MPRNFGFFPLQRLTIVRHTIDYIGILKHGNWICAKIVKFIYSEKDRKFCEISTLLLSYVVPVKSKVEISQNLVAFSEYMNFNLLLIFHFLKNEGRNFRQTIMRRCDWKELDVQASSEPLQFFQCQTMGGSIDFVYTVRIQRTDSCSQEFSFESISHWGMEGNVSVKFFDEKTDVKT